MTISWGRGGGGGGRERGLYGGWGERLIQPSLNLANDSAGVRKVELNSRRQSISCLCLYILCVQWQIFSCLWSLISNVHYPFGISDSKIVSFSSKMIR